MNQKSLNWGIGITVVWLAVIVAFWIFGGLESPSSLNELGDFLAGIFAPVAFFWLILGYVQQGKQNNLNSEAIKFQMEAMNNAIKPILQILQTKYLSKNEYTKELSTPKIELIPAAHIHFVLKNIGWKAVNIRFVDKDDQAEIYRCNTSILDTDKEIELKFELKEHEFRSLQYSGDVCIPLKLIFTNVYGVKYIHYHDFNLSKRAMDSVSVDVMSFLN
ncbi:hypothetical protein [Acinetobacter terrestris]|jgi:hypothetical protein|uniref:hypothetical protein n=1 Tax=Acinetobacter terrestris TaxID=2529843 RepID=UPI001038FFAF|nr:hypothetical protein [Acinetobacter terrestris]TCB63507.1 hypothetical protein E0H81_10285 [Acinetobacter terrestris]